MQTARTLNWCVRDEVAQQADQAEKTLDILRGLVRDLTVTASDRSPAKLLLHPATKLTRVAARENTLAWLCDDVKNAAEWLDGLKDTIPDVDISKAQSALENIAISFAMALVTGTEPSYEDILPHAEDALELVSVQVAGIIELDDEYTRQEDDYAPNPWAYTV